MLNGRLEKDLHHTVPRIDLMTIPLQMKPGNTSPKTAVKLRT